MLIPVNTSSSIILDLQTNTHESNLMHHPFEVLLLLGPIKVSTNSCQQWINENNPRKYKITQWRTIASECIAAARYNKTIAVTWMKTRRVYRVDVVRIKKVESWKYRSDSSKIE